MCRLELGTHVRDTATGSLRCREPYPCPHQHPPGDGATEMKEVRVQAFETERKRPEDLAKGTEHSGEKVRFLLFLVVYHIGSNRA